MQKANRTYHLFACLHQESLKWPRARCAHKMTRYCAGTTLVDIFAEKFAFLASNPIFESAWIEVPIRKTEDAVSERVSGHGVKVVRPTDGHYSSLKEAEATHVVWMNPCLAFLKPSTVLEALTAFNASNADGMTTAREVQNWFWDIETHESLTIKDKKDIRLQEAKKMLLSTHAMHIYNREYKIKTGGYWDMDKAPPMIWTMPNTIECLDVDSELDFEVVDAMMEARRK